METLEAHNELISLVSLFFITLFSTCDLHPYSVYPTSNSISIRENFTIAFPQLEPSYDFLSSKPTTTTDETASYLPISTVNSDI